MQWHRSCTLPVLLGWALFIQAPYTHAQPAARDLAKQEYLQGQNYEKAADLVTGDERHERLILAESSYEKVWDLDDAENQLGDIRAETGIHLGMIFVKLGKLDDGLKWFDRVAAMKGVPEVLTSNARQLAARLREKMKQANE